MKNLKKNPFASNYLDIGSYDSNARAQRKLIIKVQKNHSLALSLSRAECVTAAATFCRYYEQPFSLLAYTECNFSSTQTCHFIHTHENAMKRFFLLEKAKKNRIYTATHIITHEPFSAQRSSE